MSERILCAAIHVQDGVPRVHQPVQTGFIVGGHRHHNCLEAVAATVERSVRKHQGFLTTRGRYVGREEALRIAISTGQVVEGETHKPDELFSEDLY